MHTPSDAIQAPNDLLEVLVGPVTRLRRLSMDFFEIRWLRWASRGY